MDNAIPAHLLALVNQELEPSETVQWADMPVPRFFTPKATASFLFAIPWTAFSVFWMAGAAGFQLPNFNSGFGLFPLFGLPFFLIGLGLLSSPILAYRKALKTIYVITDQRAITFDGGRSTTIRSYPPEKLQDVFRHEKRNGIGNVIIARRAWRDSDGDKHSEELGFLRIRNAKRVEQMLKELANSVRSES